MNSQRLLVAAGIAMLGVGLAALVAPGAFAFGDGELLVSMVGLAALVLAFRTAALGGTALLDRVGLEQAATPDPESPSSVPVPGEDFAAVLAQFTDRPLIYRQSRYEEGLREAAVAILTRYGHVTESEARARLEGGTWTDDQYAAALLGDPSESAIPLAARLRTYVADETFYQRSVRRTVDALVGVAGVSVGPGDDADGHGVSRRLGRWIESLADADAASEEVDPEARSQVDADAHPRETGHWEGISLVVLVGIGVGVLADQPAVLLVGVVGIGYAAFARSNPLGDPALSVERSIDDDRPDPGDSIAVTVTVTNDGDGVLPDVRLVDGVPGPLSVVDGSPRLGTTLRPGEHVSMEYTVAARRGVHDFDPLAAFVRNLPASVERELRVGPTEPTTVTCLPRPEATPSSLPLHDRSTRYTGSVDSSSGGDGAEFYATRDYRPGDPMNRVDWNRHARTGELATLLFREERNASVLLVIDVREESFVGPRPLGEHAVDRSVDATGAVFATLLDAGNRVGITALDHDDCWLGPGTGAVHRTRARTLLGTHPALTTAATERRPDPFRWKRLLRHRLPADTQLVVFSPLSGPSVVRTVHQLAAYGYPITVVSPDPTAGGSAGQRLARVARDLRVTDLRQSGVPVADWAWDESLPVSLARFAERRDG